jgi:hypothetical protein
MLRVLGILGELRNLGMLSELGILGVLGTIGEVDWLISALIPWGRWLASLWILLAHLPILVALTVPLRTFWIYSVGIRTI